MRPVFPPASFFGMPLGILGLGLAWRTAVHLWALPPLIAEVILGAGALLWAFITILYSAKWVLARSDALAEFDHPVMCCFVGLAPVTASLAGLAVLPYVHPLAVALFALGAWGTLGFALYRTGRLWMGGRELGATTPVLYLPAVAGSFVTATAASLLGWKEWGQLAFGAGMFSWLAIESVLLHRLYSGPALPPPQRPLLGIQLAPPAVSALAYLNVGSGAPDLFVEALIGYGLLQALLLARLAPWILAQPPSASLWAFSFGAAALAGAAVKLSAAGAPVEQALAPAVFILANALIAGLALLTLSLLVRGKLLPPTALPDAGPA